MCRPHRHQRPAPRSVTYHRVPRPAATSTASSARVPFRVGWHGQALAVARLAEGYCSAVELSQRCCCSNLTSRLSLEQQPVAPGRRARWASLPGEPNESSVPRSTQVVRLCWATDWGCCCSPQRLRKPKLARCSLQAFWPWLPPSLWLAGDLSRSGSLTVLVATPSGELGPLASGAIFGLVALEGSTSRCSLQGCWFFFYFT